MSHLLLSVGFQLCITVSDSARITRTRPFLMLTILPPAEKDRHHHIRPTCSIQDKLPIAKYFISLHLRSPFCQKVNTVTGSGNRDVVITGGQYSAKRSTDMMYVSRGDRDVTFWEVHPQTHQGTHTSSAHPQKDQGPNSLESLAIKKS